MTPLPSPGSPEAQEQGCTCSGEYNLNCPLHRPESE